MTKIPFACSENRSNFSFPATPSTKHACLPTLKELRTIVLQIMVPDSQWNKLQVGFSASCQSPHCLLPATRYSCMQRANTAGLWATGLMLLASLSPKINKLAAGQL